jgi:predicted Zn-dependent protease
MADEYLQTLEDAEKTFGHMIDLLNQAIKDLDQYEEASKAYASRHPEHGETGHAIADALKPLQNLLHEVVDQHNRVAAMLAEKKLEVQQHGKEYAPDSL